MVSITFFFFIGGAAATLMRLELMTPAGRRRPRPRRYNRLFTLHGVMMVFFFLIPSIPAVLGNFLVPMMIGARDLAFPKLNLLSWYIFMLGGLFAIWRHDHRRRRHRLDVLHALQHDVLEHHVVAAALGVFITGFSSILTGLNFIVTIHTMRAPGHDLVPPAAVRLVAVRDQPDHGAGDAGAGHHDRACWRWSGSSDVGIFDPALGGDPILFQHLFWFYSHPAVYIMVLPGMGVVSEIVPCFSRRPIFGYRFMAFASMAIAVLGFLVWGHHMFVSGQSMYAGMVFSILSFLVAIPSAIKVFNWTATLYKGSVSFDTPMLYALGFIGLFTIGGLTGLLLASLGLDVHVHDTYFVVAHFHYIMVGGTVMAYLAGIHFWWPKMTGRMYPELWGKLSALTGLRRVQPDVLPAVHARLPGNAPALLRVSARVPGAERHVDGRRLDPGRRLRPAAGLPAPVARNRRPRAAATPGGPRGWSGRHRPRRRPTTSTRRRS